MTSLKKQQASEEKNLKNYQETLAEKEKNLLDAEEDLAGTEKDKKAVEDYLKKIKPGCDFIVKNFSKRESSRGTEKSALNKAIGLIKGTPAYKSAVKAATEEGYGDCKDTCVKDKNHVKCKACLADVTIP